MHEGGASNEAAGGESMELLLAAVSSLDGGEVIDANEQLASVARESERFAQSWQQAKQDSYFCIKAIRCYNLYRSPMEKSSHCTLRNSIDHKKGSISKAGKGLHQSIQVCDATSYKAYNRSNVILTFRAKLRYFLRG